MTQAPTDEAIAQEELVALQAKVAALEAEREAEHEAMTRAVKRVQDRATWARGLTLPAASHLDGCPTSFETWYEGLTPEQQQTVRVNLTKAEAEPDEGPPAFGTGRIAKGYAESADPSEVRRQRRESGS